MLYLVQVTVLDVPTAYSSTPILVFGGDGIEPDGVAVHHLTDMIYVVDPPNDRVCEFNSSGHVMSCMAGYRTVDDITVNFNTPRDISLMTNNRMVISDNHRVVLMYTNTTLIHVWGSLSTGSGLGQFSLPFGVASVGDLIYVADHDNERIQVLNVNTNNIDVIDVTADDPSRSYTLRGLAVDPVSGDIFGIANNGRYIITYDNAGHYVRHLSSEDLGVTRTEMTHIDIHRGQVHASDIDADCIHVLLYNGSYVQRLGVPGTCPGCFSHPRGVAIHSVSGHLIVADLDNNNLQIFIPL